jgi:CSLREA domain-containing protein
MGGWWGRRAGRSLACGLAVFTAAWLLPGAASAAPLPFQVNSVGDGVDATPGDDICRTSSDVCTLRAAVMEANASAGLDTIIVPAGTFSLTLGPTDNGGLSTEAAQGSGDLDVTDDLIVDGAGTNSTIIDGESLDRVFDVGYGNDGATTGLGLDLTVRDLTIRDGYAQEDTNPPDYTEGNAEPYGGAIRYDGFDTSAPSSPGSLTIDDMTITAHRADQAGGAVFVRFGDVTVDGSIFVGNQTVKAGDGGALVYGNSQPNGDLSIANSAFTGNRAVRGTPFDGHFGHLPTGGNGGALNAQNGPGVTITNTTFAGNEGEVDGGAVFTNNKAFSLSGSTVSGNKAGRHGGGIYSDADVSVDAAATTTITGTTLSGNAADAAIGALPTSDGVGNGGGVFHMGGKLALSGSTIGASHTARRTSARTRSSATAPPPRAVACGSTPRRSRRP